MWPLSPPVRRCARTRPPRLVLQLSASPRDRPLVVRIAGDRRADRDRGLLAVARAACELFSCSVRPGQPPKPGLSCEEVESGIYETTRSDSQAGRDIQPRHVSVQVPTCMRAWGDQLRVPHLAEQRVRSGACTSYWLGHPVSVLILRASSSSSQPPADNQLQSTYE